MIKLRKLNYFGENLRERLKNLISVTKLNQKEFAERISVSSSALTQFLKGQSKGLNSDTLLSIINEFNVNPAWLLTGEGEMFTSHFDRLSAPPPKAHPPGETPKVMQSDAPSRSGSLAGLNGGVDEVDVDIDHVKWFRSLSRKKQTAILAIAEIEDEEYIDEVKGSTLFKLRQQRDTAKAREEAQGVIRKKGEAG